MSKATDAIPESAPEPMRIGITADALAQLEGTIQFFTDLTTGYVESLDKCAGTCVAMFAKSQLDSLRRIAAEANPR